ncbi:MULTISPECIES: transcriptional regulator [Rhodococcus]|uniref:transcriptional regulator n=1 Tax=Rhodococcus globerulus TaxID=33008 RepID=UPI001FD47F2D|nr:transcriptional regulator [Rhodococcus globerulus]
MRKRLGLTDGNLGRHLATLSEAGLVSISRNYGGRRVRSWAHLTGQGYVSLDLELRTLQSIIDTVRQSRRITADPPPRDVET